MRWMILVVVTFLFLCSSSKIITDSFNVNSKNIYELNNKEMRDTMKYGIEGLQAPELRVDKWVNGQGKEQSEAVLLKDMEGKFKVIYCFQAWCPGCHSRGLPALQKMVKELKENDKIKFLAIQTVFEGKHANTFERMIEIQKEYELEIPFGHDEGDTSSNNRSKTMFDYRTGGTPWFILIDENNRVIFNDFHLNVDKAIEYLKSL